MTVDSTHSQYDAALPVWQRARDVLAGEDAVKAAGEKYLPRMDSQTEGEYASYRKRAAFFNATGRTLEEYLDLIFRRAPILSVERGARSQEREQTGPEAQMGSFLEDCDGWGTEFGRYARRVVSDVLSVGRAGSLVLQDSEAGGPCVSFWSAENILNWSVGRVGARMALTCVVLREKAESGKQKAEMERLRVLQLIGSQCFQEVWVQADPPSPGGFPLREASAGQAGVTSPLTSEVSGAPNQQWLLHERVALKRDGVPLRFIPFVFHGARHSRPETDRLPLADIIAANLDHYRLDADYKHGLHFTALPTAWVSGFKEDSPLRIGSSSAWAAEASGASAGFLEFSGRGLSHLERAIEKVERRMTLFGAEMLASSATAPAGVSGDLCGLGAIVASLNQSLSRVLQLARWWVEGDPLGETGPTASAVRFAMNTDLNARAMAGDEITAVVAAWRAGAISRDTMLERLKRGEVLPDGRSVAQERELIHGKAEGRK